MVKQVHRIMYGHRHRMRDIWEKRFIKIFIRNNIDHNDFLELVMDGFGVYTREE
jgi:hypothetical protein